MFDWAQRCTCVFPPIIALKNPHFPQKKSWLDGPPFYSSHDEVEDDNGDDNVDISGGDHGDDNYDDEGDHNDDDNDVVMTMVTMITMFFSQPEAPDQCHDNLQTKTSKLCQVCHCAMSPVHQSFTSRSKDLKLKLWFQKTFHKTQNSQQFQYLPVWWLELDFKIRWKRVSESIDQEQQQQQCWEC